MKRSFGFFSVGVWLVGGSVAWAACVNDADGDGICDGVDVCSATIAGVAVDLEGCPPTVPGDRDRDGDVDLTDYNAFASCASAPNSAASAACCTAHTDFDLDLDVDFADFAVFQRCFSGANHPADPNCARQLARVEAGCLHVVGTAAGSAVALRLRPGFPAFLDLDFGNDGTTDMSFLRAGFDCIVVDARDGDDLVVIDEVNGVFTDTELTTIHGDDGDDVLDGGSGAEVFVGGKGDDAALMGPGHDRFYWNDGDGTDIIEGEDGVDVIALTGSDAAETFTVTANGTRVRFDRLSPSPFFLDINGCESLELEARGGSDSVACTGNLTTLIQITVDGGEGADTLLGGNGADVLIGGDGDDFVDGNQGNDVVYLGDGDDDYQWDPGDGNDIVEGESGYDVLTLNGSNGSEIFDLSANGSRLRFARNLGNVVLDVDGVEQFDLKAFGGVDIATVNDLAGTEVAAVNIALAASQGGGDSSADSVVVGATNSIDSIAVAGSGTSASVAGLAVMIGITGAEAANDRITVNALGGNDTVQAFGLPGGVIALTVNGGTGNDTIAGSAGADALNGNDDNDTITGGDGDDVVNLGPGVDHFIWNPDDDSDVIDGDVGLDTVEINGAGVAENFTVTANGTRVRFDRLNATPFFLDIGTCETLLLNANGGDDSLACTGNLVALIQITANGGPGEDTLLGGNGNDVLNGDSDNDFVDGNQGADTVSLGAGDDVFQWDPGDGNDTIEGGAGHDDAIVNGSAIGESFDFAANAARVRFTRNIGSVVLDLDDVEAFDLRALGGADNATVNSLAGTDLAQVNIDLASTLGGATGDTITDAIVVNGTESPDTIDVSASGGAVVVSGLAAGTRITHSEAAFDTLTVNGLGGADAINQGPGVAGLILLTANP